jgi:alpha-D-ribose 1-methylphosphonate 5-triphosphate diphosphatase
VLTDDRIAVRPRIVAVIAGGRLLHVDDPERLRQTAHPAHVIA